MPPTAARRTDNLTAGLGRFIHFLNNLNVAPDSVTQAHADAFLQGLQAEEIAKRPEGSWRNAVNAWNHATDRVDGWPRIVLVLPKRQDVIRLPDTALPPAFVADLAAMMQRLAHPDPFADEGPMRALAASRSNIVSACGSASLLSYCRPAYRRTTSTPSRQSARLTS